MSKVMVSSSKLENICDAIRANTGGSSLLTLDDAVTEIGGMVVPAGSLAISADGTYDVSAYAQAVVNAGGGASNEDAIINGSITSIANSNVTSIRAYAFDGCNYLTDVSFPNATEIKNQAFAACPLATVYFPKVETIGADAFGFNASGPTRHYEFPKCTSIGTLAFEYNFNLQWISFDEITAVPTLGNTNAFNNCNSLTAFYFPDALVDTAKVATNWSSYATKIKPLSEKPSA